MDIYDATGKKIAHLLHYLPDVKTGDVVIAKVGREFGLTPEERANLADTIYRAANKRVKVVVVDESTSIETVRPGDYRASTRS